MSNRINLTLRLSTYRVTILSLCLSYDQSVELAICNQHSGLIVVQSICRISKRRATLYGLTTLALQGVSVNAL